MNRRILTGFFTSAIQTVIYLMVFYVGATLATFFHEPKRLTISEVVGFGAYFKYSVVAFFFLMILMNFADAILYKKMWTRKLLVLVTIFYFLIWGQGIDYTPLKTILFLVTGLIAINSKILIDIVLSKILRVSKITHLQQEL